MELVDGLEFFKSKAGRRFKRQKISDILIDKISYLSRKNENYSSCIIFTHAVLVIIFSDFGKKIKIEPLDENDNLLSKPIFFDIKKDGKEHSIFLNEIFCALCKIEKTNNEHKQND